VSTYIELKADMTVKEGDNTAVVTGCPWYDVPDALAKLANQWANGRDEIWLTCEGPRGPHAKIETWTVRVRRIWIVG
jgi:hypothetical protein